jgi:hypothetical protein
LRLNSATAVAAKQRNVAGGYGRRRRLAAGWRLAAVRSGGGFLGCACGWRGWWRRAGYSVVKLRSPSSLALRKGGLRD